MTDSESLKKSTVSYREGFSLQSTPYKTSLIPIDLQQPNNPQETTKRKTILLKPKRQTIFQEDGINIVPRPLYLSTSIKERQISFSTELPDSSINELFMDPRQSHVQSITGQRSETQQIKTDTSSTFNRTRYLTSYIDDVYLDDEIKFEEEPESNELSFGGIEPVIPKKIPIEISLILNETETEFLLDLASCTALKDSKEGELVDEDNKLYDYLTIGRGRNRKVVNAEVQTLPVLQKTRNTKRVSIKHCSNYAYVSNWEMYDTYNKKDEEEIIKRKVDQAKKLTKSTLLLDEDGKIPAEVLEIQFKAFQNNPRFLETVCVIERLLASNYYKKVQMCYRGLNGNHASTNKVEYSYHLELLWSFESEKTKKKSITAMEWNPINSDLIAVGYGKYYYSDDTNGVVMLWNIKNPTQPEREYIFSSPVTSMAFSKFDPHLLAIGFYNGALKIINISNRNLNVIRQLSLDDSTFEPTWQIVWYTRNELLAGYQNGSVTRLVIMENPYLKCMTIMRTIKAEGELKGCESLRICKEVNISLTKCSPITKIIFHPNDKSIYYVGTSEGTIHKCSLYYYNQHLDVFRAHNGAIRAIKFSQFANKLYWTVGDDLYARLWVDGITEPLNQSIIQLLAYIDLDFSPTHSTMLATLNCSQILIWDMQRKLHAPQSSTYTPAKCRTTICKFSMNGSCLVVGDILGNVYVYALEDLPLPAFFQYDLLHKSISKVDSVAISDLKRKIKSLGKLCY